jgi:hypothetical protein
MRWAALGIVVCLLAPHVLNAKTAAAVGREDVPYQVSVSEISKDAHIIHNRLTFDCEASEGSSGWPPKKIDCVMVQQDLQEPSSPPSKELLDKQVAEMTDGDKLKDLCRRESARRPTDKSQDIEFRKKVAKACGKPNRTEVVAALTGIFRDLEETGSQTCTMTTVVFRFTFSYVKKGVWVSYPDPIRTCTNVAVTHTLRRDVSTPSSWNYTEVTVATPSPDSLCRAESGTTEFSWRQAVTASQLGCRSVEM